MSVIIINIIPEIESVRVFENLNRTKTEGNLGNSEPNRIEKAVFENSTKNN